MNAFKGKRILIVEDSRFLAQITANILIKYGYMTEIALTGEEAVEKVCGSQCPDLILMDIELGEGMDGGLAARTIQQFRDVPVVFLTAHTEQEIVEKISSVTGYGYVLKGAGEHVLVSTVEMALRLYEANAHAREHLRLMLEGIPSPAWLVSRERRILAQNKAAEMMGTKVGNYCWGSIHGTKSLPDECREAIEKSGTPLPGTKCYFCRGDEALDKNAPINSEVEFAGGFWDTWWVPLGEDFYLHYAVDVTKYKKMEEQLYLLSITDPLTNAYNRRYFMQVLDQEIDRTRRTGLPFSIIMVDLDHFKSVNDRFGHAAGDLVLKSVVDMIKQRIRKIDCLARWGGEEFVILLPNTPVDKAAGLAEELRGQLSSMDVPGVGSVTASFGVAGYCPSDTADTLIMRADNMLYEVKSSGRNCVRFTGACI